MTSPPEAFDTALVLIALARAGDLVERRDLIARGRSFLIAQQQPDGSWIETTRPRGGESYARRISTTGWAALALLGLAGESRSSCSIRNGRESTSVFTRAEIGPARSTSNGRPTALPARSSRSVPTSSE